MQPQTTNDKVMTNGESQSPAAPAAGDLLLGRGVRFEGKLTFAGTVRIDAKFKGSIFTNDVLVVGEHARIAGRPPWRKLRSVE